MNKLVKILMRRDGLSKEEAIEMIQECREELESGNWDAIADCLGLEDDYLFDIMEF